MSFVRSRRIPPFHNQRIECDIESLRPGEIPIRGSHQKKESPKKQEEKESPKKQEEKESPKKQEEANEKEKQEENKESPKQEGKDLLPKEGTAIYYPDFLSKEEADDLFQTIDALDSHQRDVRVFGKWYKTPRFIRLEGEEYGYSGSRDTSYPETPKLTELRDRINREFGTKYNSTLINIYRNGEDYIGFHQDNEKELNENHGVVTVSLGEKREFIFKNKATKEQITVEPEHGSLIWFDKETNRHWYHSLPKRAKSRYPNKRISITLRRMENKNKEKTAYEKRKK